MKKNVVPSLSLVLKSIVQGGHVYFKTEIEQFWEYCPDQREIFLVKAYFTCKQHATFLENNELFIA